MAGMAGFDTIPELPFQGNQAVTSTMDPAVSGLAAPAPTTAYYADPLSQPQPTAVYTTDPMTSEGAYSYSAPNAAYGYSYPPYSYAAPPPVMYNDPSAAAMPMYGYPTTAPQTAADYGGATYISPQPQVQYYGNSYSYAPPVYSYGGTYNGGAGYTAAPYTYHYGAYHSPIAKSYLSPPRATTASYGIPLKPINDNVEFPLIDNIPSAKQTFEPPVKRKRKKGCC